MKSSDREKPSMKGLGSLKRKSLGSASEELIKIEYLQPDQPFPLLIQPAVAGVDLIHWVANNQEFIKRQLWKFGAILFRDFGISTVAEFNQFITNTSTEMMEYHERSSPRTQVSGKIYTSTDYPPDYPIFAHNELSFRHTFPLKIFFFCLIPALQAGETPIVDTRKVFHRINPKMKEKFMQKQWMLVRNYGEGLGFSWQDAFHMTEKTEVEEYCRNAGLAYEWKDDTHLRTRHIRPAVARHPSTQEMVWFNEIVVFHVSTLEREVRDAMLAEFKEEDLPANTYYGDGSPIETAVLDELRNAYMQETVAFLWQAGDLLMLDNMLSAHGRARFVGPRKVLVGMSEPCSWKQLQ